MTQVDAFLYRLPRFSSDFPVEFVHGSGNPPSINLGLDPATATPGQCINLSLTGLLARFVLPLGLGADGVLRLKPANRVFSLRASVTHTDGTRSGLNFHFRDSREEQIIRALVEAITGAPPAAAAPPAHPF